MGTILLEGEATFLLFQDDDDSNDDDLSTQTRTYREFRLFRQIDITRNSNYLQMMILAEDETLQTKIILRILFSSLTSLHQYIYFHCPEFVAIKVNSALGISLFVNSYSL